jgi:hypothetical protein
MVKCNGEVVPTFNQALRIEDIRGTGGRAPCILNRELDGGKWSAHGFH